MADRSGAQAEKNAVADGDRESDLPHSRPSWHRYPPAAKADELPAGEIPLAGCKSAIAAEGF